MCLEEVTKVTLTIRDSSEVAPGTEEGCRDGCEGSNVFIELEKSNGQTCSTTECKLQWLAGKLDFFAVYDIK